MTERIESDISMKRYLLGELTEPEQQELEERLMTSNECFEQLLVAEDELVDEYLRGALSTREQEKFNNHFLCTPERHEKLRFARSLQRYVSAHFERPRTLQARSPFFSFLRASYAIRGWSMATALLLLVLGGSWLSVRVHLLQRGLEQARKQHVTPAAPQQELQQQLAQLREQKDQLASKLEQQHKQSVALEQELVALKASTPQHLSSSMVAFALTPGLVRDMEGGKKLTIPAGTSWVQLQLDLGTGEYKRYRAMLQTPEGEEIWSQSTPKVRVKGDNEAIVLTLPASLLPRGDYILKLSGTPGSSGFEDVANYSFKVARK